MRIISGEFGGRRIVGPRDQSTTRPITDRVKQALFDKLQAHSLLEDGHVLDLYCGTGSLGLEALSRGSDFCTFVDQDKDAVDRLRENLSVIGIEAYAQVSQTSVEALTWVHGAKAKGPVQVAFLDPPYPLMREADAWERVERLMAALLPLMDETGVAVLRCPFDVDALPMPQWRGPREERHGGMKLLFYAPLAGVGDAESHADG